LFLYLVITVAAADSIHPPRAAACGVEFPFATDADDHCESPLEAYHDIVLLLKHLQNQHYAESQKFTIYDPYYCDGAVKRNLQQLGFDSVYHEKEDCYQQWASASFHTRHSFHVLVTNPPYSGDHMERLLQYVQTHYQTRPFFLLLPNWVVKKDYYQTCTASIRPFYLVPHKRYVYVPPKDFRPSKKSDTHKKSAPFVSMWYCWGGTMARNEALIQLFYQRSASSLACDLARSKSALRDLRRKQK
jgi:hypothetical protein